MSKREIAEIYKGTVNNLGRIEVIDKATGNTLFEMRPAETVMEFLKTHDYALSDIDIAWFDEEYNWEGDTP